ncbi:MAG: recombinase RecJ [Ruminococcaceae bacterium]|nr:recombinase RecJ [Oscillospiraceae bacterium]
MTLQEMAAHQNIVIQCHDIPDADTIASGYALWAALRQLGAQPRLVYSGRAQVTKPNLAWMLKLLGIPLEYVEQLDAPDLLVTVDCQHGAGNLRCFEAARVAVIDHHRPEIEEGPDVLIRPALGSCATLVWDLLRSAGFNFAAAPTVCTALYYGLYTDTNGFAEMFHPLDRDLADSMPFDKALIKRLKSCALTVEELDIVADTLADPQQISAIGLLKARPCDPNILGFTSDIAQQVEQFDAVVVYCPLPGGLKLSIRSAVREIMANELAAFLARDIGSGGGNIEKAGGFLSADAMEKIYPGTPPQRVLEDRLALYARSYDHVYANNHQLDFASMPRYQKLPLPLGFAKSTDLFPAGTPITVRTLEGDVDTHTAADIYLMIGVEGEVYPIKAERFAATYKLLPTPYTMTTDYAPTITNKITGDKIDLLPFAHSCVPAGEKIIRAMPLTRQAKVFTNWDTEKYFFGRVGDYIAASEGTTDDLYIINREIFDKTYRLL